MLITGRVSRFAVNLSIDCQLFLHIGCKRFAGFRSRGLPESRVALQSEIIQFWIKVLRNTP